MPEQRLFSRAAVATALDVSLRGVSNLIQRGILDPPLNAGPPRWTQEDIDMAIERLKAERTAKQLWAQAGTDAHRKAKRPEV